MQDKLHHHEGADSGGHVIQDNSGAFGQLLQLTDRRRFHNVEGPKKYKTRQKSFPCQRDGNERDQLPSNFVDHHHLRILAA